MALVAVLMKSRTPSEFQLSGEKPGSSTRRSALSRDDSSERSASERLDVTAR